MSHVGNRQIMGLIARGFVHGVVGRRQELRFQYAREWWTITKRFGVGDRIVNADVRELPVLRDAVVEGYLDDRNRAVLAALCQGLGARTFFEIGTNRGRTAWTVARSNPELTVYSLDLPSPEAAADARLEMIDADRGAFEGWQRGVAFRGTPEEPRIHQLLGDSATFDYGPYEGRMDVVFIDGSHSYEYVRSDTEAALRMLSPCGAVVWDDFPAFPGVLQGVLDAAGALESPVVHVLGTRLAIWARPTLMVQPLPEDEHRSVTVA